MIESGWLLTRCGICFFQTSVGKFAPMDAIKPWICFTDCAMGFITIKLTTIWRFVFFAFSKRPLKQIQETDRFKANPFQGGKGRIFEVYTCVFVEYPAAKSQISFINSEHKGWMISIKQQWQEWVRSLKLTASLHLKTDGWKMNFLSGWGLFSGALAVSFTECTGFSSWLSMPLLSHLSP